VTIEFRSPAGSDDTVGLVSAEPPGYPPPPPSYDPTWVPPPTSGTPPLEFGDVIDRGFRLWWRSLRAILPLAFLLVLPAAIVSTLAARRDGGLQDWLQQVQQQTETLQPGDTIDFTGLSDALVGELPSLLLALVTVTLVQGVLTAYYTDRILMRETPIADCIRPVLGMAPALIGIVLLTGLANAVGFVFCCIGILFPMTRFAVAPQAAIVERAGPLAAMKRSWHLTARRFWPILGLIIVGTLISTLVQMPFRLVAGAFGRDATGAVLIAQVAAEAFGSALGAALVASFMVFAYLDLRVRFEGLDLGRIAATPVG
jgi:hypothetical protein